MAKIFENRFARCAACMVWVIALAACGGGGSGGAMFPLTATAPASPAEPPAPAPPESPDPADTIVPSSSVAAQCAAPRSGIDPWTDVAFADRQGTLTDEKNWLRAWIDETYLWFDEVPATLRAKDYATPVAYFDVLKTPKLTATGRPKDRFHFAVDTEEDRSFSQGIEVGYGLALAFISASAPRDIRVAFTEPESPAAQAAVVRGDRLIEVDGIDVINGIDTAALQAAISSPREGEQHRFKLRANDGAERTVTMTAASITRTPVQNLRAYTVGDGVVGYMLFNDHWPRPSGTSSMPCWHSRASASPTS